MPFYSFHVHACGRGDSICSPGSWSEGKDRFAIEDTSACKRSFVNRHINLTLTHAWLHGTVVTATCSRFVAVIFGGHSFPSYHDLILMIPHTKIKIHNLLSIY
jgi:hypothetical protein